jgi:hypothetical protein
MALIFTGRTAPRTDGATGVQAKDATTGENVPVKVSSEVMEDHGLGAAQQVADQKHSAGNLEPDGSVWVRVDDF